MGNIYEDMFTGGGGGKKKSKPTKEYDWMKDAIGGKKKSKPTKEYDWMKDAIGGASNGSKNPAMTGFDINSVIKPVSKKAKPANVSNSIKNAQKTVKNVRSTIKTIRNFKDDQILLKAKELEAKEKRAAEVAAAKAKIDDYNTRKAEFEARERERKKESGQQSVFQKLRNLRKSQNKMPDHLQNKNE
jgi:Xaa-Pro aminopeptidase